MVKILISRLDWTGHPLPGLLFCEQVCQGRARQTHEAVAWGGVHRHTCDLSVQDAQSLSGRTAACVLQKQYSAQDFYEIIKHWKIETGSSCLGRATDFWRRHSMCCTCGSGELDCHCI